MARDPAGSGGQSNAFCYNAVNTDAVKPAGADGYQPGAVAANAGSELLWER